MANPRQRRKARSSSHRPVGRRHSKKLMKKFPAISGPKILQDSWDHSKTVRQNYASLGLVYNLNPIASGGVEIKPSNAHAEESPTTSGDVLSTSEVPPIPKGHGKILRDADGNVVGIELADADEDSNEQNDQDQDMESLEPHIPSSILDKWASDLGGAISSAPTSNVVTALESLSSMPTNASKPTISASITGIGPRHSSVGEKLYLQRLMDRYGPDNVTGMARDRELNPDQRTEGQLRRALRRGFATHG